MKNFIKIDNEISILGLDIGNCTLKGSTDVLINSKITAIEPLTKSNKLFIDENVYYLGHGNYDTTYRKVKKQHYINMMYGLLGLSTNTVHNVIGLGLPLSQFKSDRQELINLVLKNREKIIQINGEEKPIIIDDVFVYPEGLVTLQEGEEAIIIDIGGLTTDVAMTIYERGIRRIIKPVSIPTGTINLYNDFINKINSEYSLNLSLDDGERILEKGLAIKGHKVNIDFALETYSDYVEHLISKLQLNYNLEINNISLTGGGATLLYNQLKNRLGDGVALQEDSIYANARNFAELAKIDYVGE